MSVVVAHLRNPHIPERDSKGNRNVFGISSDGLVIQFTTTGCRTVDRIPTAHIPLWFRSKQIQCGWIPVRITTDDDGYAKVVDLVDYA